MKEASELSSDSLNSRMFDSSTMLGNQFDSTQCEPPPELAKRTTHGS